ncbi:MAG: phytanoyl-CoA dioxygenase family protein [candidate division Zixibacteria bacterium]|nr:phytanoyl-CoA dioxygenase family protein [candidate division Zixibacteria bacterium]
MELTASERRQGRLTQRHLQGALRRLRDTGYVALERALPDDWITQMRSACDRDLKKYLRIKENRERFLVKNKGHVGMFPSPTLPYMDPMAILNPFALQIFEAAMGHNVFCTFYNTNTAWPGSGVQVIHRDTQPLFPELSVALPVHMVVVNIMLVDFTVENGATEVWPGSHLLTDGRGDREVPLEERAAFLRSERTTVPAGTLVVRDLRMWHRGMPNQTDQIRTMLAIVYFRDFMHRNDVMTIPSAVWDDLPEHGRHLFRHNTIK